MRLLAACRPSSALSHTLLQWLTSSSCSSGSWASCASSSWPTWMLPLRDRRRRRLRPSRVRCVARRPLSRCSSCGGGRQVAVVCQAVCEGRRAGEVVAGSRGQGSSGQHTAGMHVNSWAAAAGEPTWVGHGMPAVDTQEQAGAAHQDLQVGEVRQAAVQRLVPQLRAVVLVATQRQLSQLHQPAHAGQHLQQGAGRAEHERTGVAHTGGHHKAHSGGAQQWLCSRAGAMGGIQLPQYPASWPAASVSPTAPIGPSSHLIGDEQLQGLGQPQLAQLLELLDGRHGACSDGAADQLQLLQLRHAGQVGRAAVRHLRGRGARAGSAACAP